GSDDGEFDLFFFDRSAVRIFSQLQIFFRDARTVRHRHGRAVGRRNFAGDGSGAGEVARSAQRGMAERVFEWLFAGGGCGAIFAASMGLARDVLGRSFAGAAGALYPVQSAGVGSMETAQGGQRGTGVACSCEGMEA